MRQILLLLLAPLLLSPSHANDPFVYFGTYTKGESGSQGIYVSTLDLETGVLSEPALAVEANNPSFLEIHPSGQYLYAASETTDGTVTAYQIDPKTGTLTLLNQQPSGGAHPCHLSLDSEGRMLMVANYSGGSVSSYRIQPDGRLEEAASFIQHEGSSVNERRQKAPHAHSINPSTRDDYAFAADLGTDDIFIYQMDPASGTLTPTGSAELAPGSGPRHFVFHPAGELAWVINELTRTMTGFQWDANSATLSEVQTITTIPEAEKSDTGQSTAEVRVHPSGRFLYGSNRGHNSFVVYSIDRITGELTLVEYEPSIVETPRNFNLTPDGRWLLAAGQKSADVIVFEIDQNTGELTPTESRIQVGAPVCIRFLSLWDASTEDNR